MNKNLLTEKKKEVMNFFDDLANRRDHYINKSRTYYKELIRFLRYNIQEGSRVLEVGCGTGYLLDKLKPRRGVGIDLSLDMLSVARKKYPHLTFIQDDVESLTVDEKFDYVVISDTIGYLEDIQLAFKRLWNVCHPDTRIIITFQNFLWEPILSIAQFLKLKMPQIHLNWLNKEDINNLLFLERFEPVKQEKKLLLPINIPLITWFVNKYIANLPLLNRLCLIGYIVARAPFYNKEDNTLYSVSVVVPARNEKGNIEDVVKQCPLMGKHTEIVFVEGHSTDNTLEEIKRVHKKYSKSRDVKFTVQEGDGKYDAIKKGFLEASGDILMILDADLTVNPRELTKFYNAIATGQGEFINGSRLVYPMEKEAMRTLNMIGNKFFSVVFTWLLGQKLKDTLCGTKVITKKNWDRICKNRNYFGDFDPFGDFDLLFGASKLNLRIVEIPIRYRSRQYGTTNISRFQHGWLLLKMVIFAMNRIKFVS